MTPILSLLALGTVPAAAGQIHADMECGGTLSPGDTVPYSAILDEQGGVDHLIELNITIDTPAASHLRLQKTIFLFANQLVSWTRTLETLGANAPPGLYEATMTVTENGKSQTDSCTFDVL